MTSEKSVLLDSKNAEVGNYYGIRTMLVSVSESNLQRELETGK